MILHEEIRDLVVEWGLREDILEKDYVLSWLLWGIGSDPVLSETWIFKGGTCLKKCFLETYRFSEDLDFTVLPAGPVTPAEVVPVMEGILSRIKAESGIDCAVRPARFRSRRDLDSTEGRLYYRGPRQTSTPGSVKLDLSRNEIVVLPTVLRPIAHFFSDPLPVPGTVRTYAFSEVFAEKIRAMGERCRPRDLYDLVHLFRRGEFREHPDRISPILADKCAFKGIPVPTFPLLETSPYRDELVSEWENMLGHQLPALPAFEPFWDELEALFDWLEGRALPSRPAPMAASLDEDPTWRPPPTITPWRVGLPLETIRFAAVNHLCIELGYQGSPHGVEPYALRRTRDGHLILHVVRVEDRVPQSYRVDRIESVRITDRPFTPQYAIEVSSTGPSGPSSGRMGFPGE